eukprot:CAMPEP_0182444926 /NCGR_PEP_ID=MMETSP1172-20130603/3223_1 /TAXON_ID=708627 /ORGANISM="Timspurckia oligopyrenoides, Strain CCMP3278" /LENGTH=379 /DNA_ID=CAMNT_0024640591 /DNA_START=30 /DNA_END=1169 /DNA_ORIENTATION=-
MKYIGLFGIGGVGQSLIEQICSLAQLQTGLNSDQTLNLVMIADSSGLLWNSELNQGFDESVLSQIVLHKRSNQKCIDFKPQSTTEAQVLVTEHQSNSDLIKLLLRYQSTDNSSSVIDQHFIIDCTATDFMESLFIQAIKSKINVVSANKKPFTSCTMDVYNELVSFPDRIRYESTVGAGLPVLCSLDRMISSNDKIESVSGALSGTLSLVFSELEKKRLFSEIVQDALAKGYTEPDPRDDLSGKDVGRKALILARKLGWNLEFTDVQVEPLFPEKMSELSVEEFLNELSTLDETFSERVRDASVENQVVRYVATISGGKCIVGLKNVQKTSAIGQLQGTDNLIEITSQIYVQPQPLIIRGPGAGTQCTANGVLADILSI